MADVLNTSPSVSSYDKSFTDSPSNYTINRGDYEVEGLKRAFIDLLKLTIPITITSLFVSLLLAANLIWIGHHATEHQFAGAALGNMIVNVMGNSIIIGMTSGLDTQCGQAFGARLYKMMGVLVQRSILISHIVIVCIAGVFWFADDLLKLAGQNKDAANEAAIFIRIFIASLWPIAMFGNLRRYLQAQRQVIFIPVAVLIGLCMQIVALVVFVNILKWEYIGACIALPCSYWSMTLSLYTFTRCNKSLKKAVSKTWPGWGKWALRDWPIFLKLSIPGTFQLCAEWWAMEVMAVFAGHFGTQYVAAFTVTLNAIGVFARLPLGISFSAAVLVGNKLGAQRPMSAKIIYDCSVALSIVSGVLFGICLWLFAEPFSHIYTEVESIRPIVADALPYAGIYFVFYAYQRASAGGARGMGRQNIGAAIYIFAYYFVGMPLGIWFGFDGIPGTNREPLYIKGLWIGASISAVIGSFFFLFFRLWVNWDRECGRALKRIEAEQEKMRVFKHDVKQKFGDIIEEEPGLLGDEEQVNEGSTAQHPYDESLGFKVDNGGSHDVFDETEPDWNNNRQPRSKPYTYNAPELSTTRHTINSLPSQSYTHNLTIPYDMTHDRDPQQSQNDMTHSMNGVHANDNDNANASLMSNDPDSNDNNEQRTLTELNESQSSSKHSFV